MDLDELSLPEMQLDDTFATDWSVLEEDETTGLYGGSSIIVPPSDLSLFAGAEQKGQPGYTTPSPSYIPDDMQFIRSDQLGLQKVDSGKLSTCTTNYPKELSVESTPQSPLLAATDGEKQLEKELSMASFEDLTDDQQSIQTAPGNGIFQANDDIETHYQTAPTSPCSSEKDERTTFTPQHLIGMPYNPQLNRSRNPTPTISPVKASYRPVKLCSFYIGTYIYFLI